MNTAKIVLTDLPIDSTDAPDENVFADRQGGSKAPPLSVMPVWMALEALSQEFDEKSRDESRPMAETHVYSLRAMEMGICAELLKPRVAEGLNGDPRFVDDPIDGKATAMDLERGYSILNRKHSDENARSRFNELMQAEVFQGWKPGMPTGDVKRAVLIWNTLLTRIVEWLESQRHMARNPTAVMQVAALLRSRLLFEMGILIREMVG